ncbi:hypothetical protein AB9L18_14255 [Stenotrophomonas lactitubi]|jgi:hypothetical protein|uniref:hypothetical protein n=1 Tax=Stenotrophomonas lactitubi TaxID=2045214 RepID=UPI0035C250E8
MTSLWPDSFSSLNLISAKSLLEEQASLLPQITSGYVSASVKPVERHQASAFLFDDFIYKFELHGTFLENYSFTVLTFSHDITLYPIKFSLDEALARELGASPSPLSPVKIRDQESLISFTSAILRSERVNSVIGSIIRMSRA